MYQIQWKTDKGICGNGESLPFGVAKAWIDRQNLHGKNYKNGIFLPFHFGKNIDNSIKHWRVKV
jgi:hypothetical protein